jgi:hypothetical protein
MGQFPAIIGYILDSNWRHEEAKRTVDGLILATAGQTAINWVRTAGSSANKAAAKG